MQSTGIGRKTRKTTLERRCRFNRHRPGHERSTTEKALRVHIEDDDKVVNKMDTTHGIKPTTFINESGLYSLILSSKLLNKNTSLKRLSLFLFCGKDVYDELGYKNPQKALRDHMINEDKLGERIVLSGQNRYVTFINESGLYSLIL
ncbi:MAG: hypothetical protein II287_03725, partial [Bacteroidaceae bacterium]|nr:hypothetical protein [Bacteroidaceae bacterium]